jgi:hypothetical protein
MATTRGREDDQTRAGGHVIGIVIAICFLGAIVADRQAMGSRQAVEANQLRQIALAAISYQVDEGCPPPDLDTLVAYTGGELTQRTLTSRRGTKRGIPPPHYHFDFARMAQGTGNTVLGWTADGILDGDRHAVVYVDGHTSMIQGAIPVGPVAPAISPVALPPRR